MLYAGPFPSHRPLYLFTSHTRVFSSNHNLYLCTSHDQLFSCFVIHHPHHKFPETSLLRNITSSLTIQLCCVIYATATPATPLFMETYFANRQTQMELSIQMLLATSFIVCMCYLFMVTWAPITGSRSHHVCLILFIKSIQIQTVSTWDIGQLKMNRHMS